MALRFSNSFEEDACRTNMPYTGRRRFDGMGQLVDIDLKVYDGQPECSCQDERNFEANPVQRMRQLRSKEGWRRARTQADRQ